MRIYTYITIIVLFSSINILKAQTGDSTAKKLGVRIYANLFHQHHDFFGKAFSYQGLETSFFVTNKLFAGIYGSCFVTNLKADVNNKSQFIWIGQYGINGGYVFYEQKRFHPGAQLSAGYFSLRTDESNFGLFETHNAKYKLNGFAISPQIFGELNTINWLKIRIGFSYNWYDFQDKSIIQTSDLNSISFTFGMLFLFNEKSNQTSRNIVLTI